MDNPGPFVFTLNQGAFSLSAAGAFVGDWIEDFAGVEALSLQASFTYGGGGGEATLFFQTSLDQGQTPIDIAAVALGDANSVSVVNLSALTPVTTPLTPAQQSLAPGTSVNGVLGDRFRAVLVVASPFAANTALAACGVAR